MGWSIRAAAFNEHIHSLVYQIMTEVEEMKGQDAAAFAGRYLYHHLKSSSGFCACMEGTEEPCGIVFFSPHELRFLYVDESDISKEIASSLFEHAISTVRADLKSSFIFSTFPSWISHLGQDLLTPLMAENKFTELHLIRLSASIESKEPARYLDDAAIKSLRNQGYSIDGWRSRDHLRISKELIVRNPNPLIENLIRDSSSEGLEWLDDHIFIDEMGREISYPPECSSTVWHRDSLVGVLLCSEKGWIHQIAVESPHQRKGIAQAMMTRAYQAMKVLKIPAMALSVYEESPAALSWYKKLGFSPTLQHSVWCLKKE
ncbi:MAG: GNAT family N-acetyltransferase [Candidatus Xenobiia bacterium LiM19]